MAKTLTDKINEARKAIAGFLVPAAGTVIAALDDGHISAVEWVTIVDAALVGGGAVYGISNARSSDPDTSTPDL
jgi:hypothetical protein